MKLKSVLAIVTFASLPGVSYGATGIFDELLWTTTVAPFAYGTATFREIDSDTANLFGAAEFQGANLGIFNVGAELYLTGQQKSFKNSGSDVSAHTLFWSLDGGTTSTPLSYVFQANIGGGGDQRWGADAAGTLTGNVLSGLTPGSYTLSVWSTITTNGTDSPVTVFNNNGGSNFNANFTVIPEPASAMLGLLGTMLLLRRKR